MKLMIIITLILMTMMTNYTQCSTKKELRVGDNAPDFMLPDEHGAMHSLSEFRGKKVALYFYPRDNTPGCSQQACNIRDNFSELADTGITIVGIGGGSDKSKLSFTKKFSLPFMLLTATKQVLRDYGTCGTWRRLWLPHRYTFLLNEHGVIVGIIKNVDVQHHSQQIIDAFNATV